MSRIQLLIRRDSVKFLKNSEIPKGENRFCDWTCIHLIMSYQKSPKFDFQSQFSMSKISFIILIFVSVIRLVKQVIIKSFCDNFIFWSTLFTEIGHYFCWLVIKWTQVESQK